MCVQFCADVQPGNARAKECLEDHLNDEGFSAGCKSEMEKMMQVWQLWPAPQVLLWPLCRVQAQLEVAGSLQ